MCALLWTCMMTTLKGSTYRQSTALLATPATLPSATRPLCVRLPSSLQIIGLQQSLLFWAWEEKLRMYNVICMQIIKPNISIPWDLHNKQFTMYSIIRNSINTHTSGTCIGIIVLETVWLCCTCVVLVTLDVPLCGQKCFGTYSRTVAAADNIT